MRHPHNDHPRSASRAALASPSMIRVYRARAVVRGRNAPVADTPPTTRSGRARGLLGLLSLLTVSVLPALMPGAAHAERNAAVEVAMVTDIAGRVERQPRTVERWNRVGLDEPVALFDAMRTWDASTAELRFVDGTVVMLDEKTRLRISPMLFDPSQAPREVQLALASGSAEVRAGRTRLWIDTGRGEPTAIEPGGRARVTAVDSGGDPIRPPARQTPSDLEGGVRLMPDTDGQGGPRGSDVPGTPLPEVHLPGPFDPSDGRDDPTELVDRVIDAVPGGVVGGAPLPGDPPEDGILDLPAPEIPDRVGGLPTLPDGPDGLLRDLIPGGIVTGLDDLPPVPTTGRVRVEVEIRRR